MQKDIEKLIVDFIRTAGGQRQAGQFCGKSRQTVGHWSEEYSAPERFLLLEIVGFLREKAHPLYVFLGLKDCERLLGFSLKRVQSLILSFHMKSLCEACLSTILREITPSDRGCREAKVCRLKIPIPQEKPKSTSPRIIVPLPFWADPTLQALSSDAKMLALYLMTGPYTPGLGCFRCSKSHLAGALHISLACLDQSLEALCRIAFIHYDAPSHWLWVTSFLEWHPIEDAHQAEAIEKGWDELPPDMFFLSQLAGKLKGQSHLRPCFLERLERLSQEAK